MRNFLMLIGLMAGLISCGNQSKDLTQTPLFKKVYEQKKEHSDKKAVKIALRVIDSSGGYEAWKNARYLNWVFFDARRWMWDKKTGDIRVTRKKDDLTILMNLNTREGKVFKDTQRVTHPDSIQKYIEKGYRMWANDSYWLFMPFKLIDSGVILKYKGEGTTPFETKADILRVSFDSVGVTPQNFYDVYVSKETSRVCFWEYYPSKKHDKPFFSVPWNNYQEFNGLKLALNHGGDNKMTAVSVRDSMNRAVFKELDPYDSLQKKPLRKKGPEKPS